MKTRIEAGLLLTEIIKAIRIYDPRESRSIGELYLEDHYRLSRADILSGKMIEYDPADLESFLERVNRHEPVQYILGKTSFYGRAFFVNPAVLIPRPETEELVHMILKRHSGEKALNVLDIGTGSGCIAVSLALVLPDARVSAFDISPEALKVASRNALLNNCKVDFYEYDISKNTFFASVFDVIVSNPPYVEADEQSLMRRNVLDYEPDLALYAPEGDPLFFYRKVLEFSDRHLVEGGYVYFEINERYGREMLDLLREFSYIGLTLIKDLSGRDRFVEGRKPGR